MSIVEIKEKKIICRSSKIVSISGMEDFKQLLLRATKTEQVGLPCSSVQAKTLRLQRQVESHFMDIHLKMAEIPSQEYISKC